MSIKLNLDISGKLNEAKIDLSKELDLVHFFLESQETNDPKSEEELSFSYQELKLAYPELNEKEVKEMYYRNKLNYNTVYEVPDRGEPLNTDENKYKFNPANGTLVPIEEEILMVDKAMDSYDRVQEKFEIVSESLTEDNKDLLNHVLELKETLSLESDTWFNITKDPVFSKTLKVCKSKEDKLYSQESFFINRYSTSVNLIESAKEVVLKFLNLIKTGVRKIVNFMRVRVGALVNFCRGLKGKITKLQAKLSSASNGDGTLSEALAKKALPKMGGLYYYFKNKPVEGIKYFSSINMQPFQKAIEELGNLNKPMTSDILKYLQTAFKDMIDLYPAIKEQNSILIGQMTVAKFMIPYRIDGNTLCFAGVSFKGENTEYINKVNAEGLMGKQPDTKQGETKQSEASQTEEKKEVKTESLASNLELFLEEEKKEPTVTEQKKEVKEETEKLKETVDKTVTDDGLDLEIMISRLKYNHNYTGVKALTVQEALACLTELNNVESKVTTKLKETRGLCDKAYGIIDKIRIQESVNANNSNTKRRLKAFRKLVGDICASISSQYVYGIVAYLVYINCCSETYNYGGAQDVSAKADVSPS